MTKQELIEHLCDETERTPKEVEAMTPYEMVDAWLRWNGIIGYTDDIIDMVFAAYKKH